MKKSLQLLAAALLCLSAASCDEQTSQNVIGIITTLFNNAAAVQEGGLPTDGGLMEVPATKPSDRIMNYTGYVASYNPETLIPDWVAYELTAEELEGDEQRGDRQFSMDKRYKGAQAMREDYYNSGWTKGHMAPATDMRWSATAMDDTFYFMNVCPQNEYLNANDWEYLEGRVRHWAREFGKVWVVSGPIIGENRYGSIGDRGVVVPDSFFKAVLAYKGGRYRSIAFIMDNDSNRYYLKDCALSVNELEDVTGLDFFPLLDDSVEENVEDRCSFSDWGL